MNLLNAFFVGFKEIWAHKFRSLLTMLGIILGVSGVSVRDELFGSAEQLGYEYNPVGEIINIKGQPFTIVGMFQRYESEQARKARELAKLKPQDNSGGGGPNRSRGWGGGRGGG